MSQLNWSTQQKILRVHVFTLTEIPVILIICLLSMLIYPSVWPVISPGLL